MILVRKIRRMFGFINDWSYFLISDSKFSLKNVKRSENLLIKGGLKKGVYTFWVTFQKTLRDGAKFMGYPGRVLKRQGLFTRKKGRATTFFLKKKGAGLFLTKKGLDKPFSIEKGVGPVWSVNRILDIPRATWRNTLITKNFGHFYFGH